MVRFKVIRASRLLLVLSIILLCAALALLAIRLTAAKPGTPSGGSANLVSAARQAEAGTAVVFASADAATALRHAPNGERIEVEVLPAPTEVPEKPRVLIYHTHTHEAYEQVNDDPYVALEAWRTTDADHSVVRVGEELTKRLREYGFEVVHDVTDHEGEDLSTAYTRSIVTLESYEEPFDLYIDLHRDACAAGQLPAFATSGGESAAQLMMLIGNGKGFDEKPYYAQNLAFAQALEDRINALEPGLCKPVLVKDGRYNQHIGVFSILVEVGNNRNTLREALNAVAPLAEGIDSLMLEDPDPDLERMRAEYRASKAL